ncbi:hypothetical protein, partial [Actinoplanes sp. NPDC026670]|uniref:hypothetical protein n=1 Tax=Actinoplanes sp. NPDC026670 TaxID=3154700 RepID=UPI0033D673C3
MTQFHYREVFRSVRLGAAVHQALELAQGAVVLAERHVGAGGAQAEVEYERMAVAVAPRVMIGELSPLAGGGSEFAGGLQLFRLLRGLFHVEFGGVVRRRCS